MFACRGTTAAAAAAALGGCAAALMLSGCYVDVGALQHHTASYSISGTLQTLLVQPHVGDVDVTGERSGQVSVTEQVSYRHTAPPTTHRVSGGTLTLSSNCPANESCRVGYDVQVPQRMTVKVSTDAGEIRLSGLAGQVTAHTNAGDIDLNTLSGPIEITDHAGSILGKHMSSPRATLSSSVGSIDVTFSAAPESISAVTAVGSVVLRVPGDVSYAVKAHTMVGSTKITVPEDQASGRGIAAHTATGSITIQPS